jgi:hypothetical protein
MTEQIVVHATPIDRFGEALGLEAPWLADFDGSSFTPRPGQCVHLYAGSREVDVDAIRYRYEYDGRNVFVTVYEAAP